MNASPRPVPDPARLEADVRALARVRHPLAAPEALAAAEDYVALELGAAGLRVERQLFEFGGAEYRNVVATRDGADGDRPWVVVGAHFDSRAGSPGADDNASGVAALLEVARMLRGARLPATIQFVGFNLEELQRKPLRYAIGSRAYARWLRARGQRVAGALVLEMLGFTSPTQGAPPGARLFSPVPRVGNFLSAVGDRRSRALLAAFLRAAAPHVPVADLTVPLRGWLLPDTRRSDNARFWDEGYAALMITDTANFRNPHYHRASDTPDTLDYAFLTRATAAVAAAIGELAGAAQPSPARPGASAGEAFAG
ncbi:MAG TPA: M28 family peptidase [Gemmatimonadales bacterium]|nr:M28 family peptidase [Gemmatimonadales bacterium]